jgi:glycerol-3-phosphate dehydrogenase
VRNTRTLTAPKRRSPVVSADPDLLPADARTRPGAAYVFIHYDNAWRYDETHGWIPQLSKLTAKPGVNGTDRRMDLSKAIQGAVSKGGTYINPKDKRLLLDGEDEADALFFDYARFYECTDGRKWWVEPGMNPTVTRSGRIIWDDDENSAAMARFSAHLRDAGIVEPMHELTYRDKMDGARYRVDNLRSRVSMNPHLAADLAAAEQRLAAMEAAWEKQTAAEEEEAVKLTRPKRKAPPS